MNPMEAAKAHFTARLAAGLCPIEVPEWPQPDGSPTVLYFGPETAEQKDEYFPAMRENKFIGFLQFLVARAKDENGRPAFRQADMLALRKGVDPDVIVEIVGRANKVLGEEVPVDQLVKP